MDSDAASFARTVLQWYRRYGRHDLPWQGQNAYRVWLSEIMLQQTQVTTVIPYYLNFVKRFPTLKSLAEASIDDVLRHWQGLGYYARARNLHRAAQIIRDRHHGRFPRDFDALLALPGIGRLFVDSLQRLDYQVVQSLVVLLAVLVVVVNLLTDLLYALIDPRIRIE